jgi:hypothetical protein
MKIIFSLHRKGKKPPRLRPRPRREGWATTEESPIPAGRTSKTMKTTTATTTTHRRDDDNNGGLCSDLDDDDEDDCKQALLLSLPSL